MKKNLLFLSMIGLVIEYATECNLVFASESNIKQFDFMTLNPAKFEVCHEAIRNNIKKVSDNVKDYWASKVKTWGTSIRNLDLLIYWSVESDDKTHQQIINHFVNNLQCVTNKIKNTENERIFAGLVNALAIYELMYIHNHSNKNLLWDNLVNQTLDNILKYLENSQEISAKIFEDKSLENLTHDLNVYLNQFGVISKYEILSKSDKTAENVKEVRDSVITNYKKSKKSITLQDATKVDTLVSRRVFLNSLAKEIKTCWKDINGEKIKPKVFKENIGQYLDYAKIKETSRYLLKSDAESVKNFFCKNLKELTTALGPGMPTLSYSEAVSELGAIENGYDKFKGEIYKKLIDKYCNQLQQNAENKLKKELSTYSSENLLGNFVDIIAKNVGSFKTEILENLQNNEKMLKKNKHELEKQLNYVQSNAVTIVKAAKNFQQNNEKIKLDIIVSYFRRVLPVFWCFDINTSLDNVWILSTDDFKKIFNRYYDKLVDIISKIQYKYGENKPNTITECINKISSFITTYGNQYITSDTAFRRLFSAILNSDELYQYAKYKALELALTYVPTYFKDDQYVKEGDSVTLGSYLETLIGQVLSSVFPSSPKQFPNMFCDKKEIDYAYNYFRRLDENNGYKTKFYKEKNNIERNQYNAMIKEMIENQLSKDLIDDKNYSNVLKEVRDSIVSKYTLKPIDKKDIDNGNAEDQSKADIQKLIDCYHNEIKNLGRVYNLIYNMIGNGGNNIYPEKTFENYKKTIEKLIEVREFGSVATLTDEGFNSVKNMLLIANNIRLKKLNQPNKKIKYCNSPIERKCTFYDLVNIEYHLLVSLAKRKKNGEKLVDIVSTYQEEVDKKLTSKVIELDHIFDEDLKAKAQKLNVK